MSARFSFEVDPVRSLVTMRMAGFFAADDLLGFMRAHEDAHARLTCARNGHVTIVDMRGMSIQSQETVQTFGDLLADPRYWSRRLAFLVDATLLRSQLKRAIGSRGARCFTDPADAEAWVLAVDEATQAA